MSSVMHEGLAAYPVETPHPNSKLIVMKFGGHSVATAENWEIIASLLKSRLDEGLLPVVVHSAIAGVSDALENLLEMAGSSGATDTVIGNIWQIHRELARDLKVDSLLIEGYFKTLQELFSNAQLEGRVSPQIHARILATGELAATTLGASYLATKGLPVILRDARDFLKSCSENNQTERAAFLSGTCLYNPEPELENELITSGDIILTQGFIAKNTSGETVLLGRGGSDTSAAYLAAKLQARRLEIWTDVPGFFSADPRDVSSARLLRSLHFREAQEIGSAGGGLLHPRSVSPVRVSGIPLFLKCTRQPGWDGTVVSNSPGKSTPQVKSISYRSGITLISMESTEMWHQVGFLARVFAFFRDHGLSVDLISTSESSITVSVDMKANVSDKEAIRAVVDDLSTVCAVSVIEDCAAISLVGQRIRTILHELSPAMRIFQEHKVHLLTQAANDLNLTFVVDSEQAYRLVQKLHSLLIKKFGEGELFGPTWEQLTAPDPAKTNGQDTWWIQKQARLLKIAAQNGAAYVYDLKKVSESATSLMSLSSVDSVFYAMKANSNPEILRILEGEGVNFECVSPGEIRRLLELFPDIDRRRLLFTPNFAPRSEYQWGLDQGTWVTLDNLHPLRYWPKIFKNREVFIRIDTGEGQGHHEHVRTAGTYSKFGIPLQEVEEMGNLLKKAGARVVGLHAHTGSGILQADNWRVVGECLLALRSNFQELRFIDLGGGLGITERHGERGLDLTELDKELQKIQVDDIKFWLEPGRFIVGEAGVLLAQVTQIKGKGDMRYVGINVGMNTLIRPTLYGAYHEIVNLSNIESAPTELVTIVGPICETGDRLGSDRLLPATQEGDVILIANVGAYGYTMSSNYNLREPAVEITI
ncbi:MAG: bifunctional aspartate kinase/diaminopimelate decarboxylase [Pseudomonadota bacterium]|nr:bifunctional aspartate kinase/diaminopimelate decarboxylase [Pseudomonadota bacterium]